MKKKYIQKVKSLYKIGRAIGLYDKAVLLTSEESRKDRYFGKSYWKNIYSAYLSFMFHIYIYVCVCVCACMCANVLPWTRGL